MRNPDRLDDFYERLRILHKANFGDWRFGQLVINFQKWVYEFKKTDIFYFEEDKMLELLEEFCKEIRN